VPVFVCLCFTIGDAISVRRQQNVADWTFLSLWHVHEISLRHDVICVVMCACMLMSINTTCTKDMCAFMLMKCRTSAVHGNVFSILKK